MFETLRQPYLKSHYKAVVIKIVLGVAEEWMRRLLEHNREFTYRPLTKTATYFLKYKVD